MEVEYLIIHHTAVSREKNKAQYEAVRNYHISKNWGDIGYNFFIEPDGLLIAGREENVTGAHCKEERMNYKSLGICLTGNFDIEYPTQEQLDTLKTIITHLRIKYNILRENVKFHKDYASYKSCPGLNFSLEMLNKCMPLLELKRDIKGGFWFVKKDGSGKQKISNDETGVSGLLTVISREFGVDTMGEKYFDKLDDKKYF